MPKRWFKLSGVTKTPVITKRRHFFHKCGVITINGSPRVFGKLTKGEIRAPMTFKAWHGTVEFIIPQSKLEPALAIESIGRYTHEGMGQILWTSVKQLPKRSLYTPRKIRIRKMLPKLSDTREKLMIAMLLHDFVNTEKHSSKIYSEVTIVDEDVYKLAKNHHNYEMDERELPLLATLQHYDQVSSSISRKFRWSTSSRYRADIQEKIDFDTLKREIELRKHSLYALYSFIYKSQVLDEINEAIEFGFSSLKNHLLLMVNLYLDDLYG